MEEAVALLRPLGDKWLMAIVLRDLAEVMVFQRQHEQAAAVAVEGLRVSQELADRRSMAWCLMPLASAAAGRGHARRAAALWGAAEGLSQSIGSPLLPTVRMSQNLHLPAAREALGDDAFATAWAEGRRMTPEEIVAYALADEVSP